jgi:hypothetical protein
MGLSSGKRDRIRERERNRGFQGWSPHSFHGVAGKLPNPVDRGKKHEAGAKAQVCFVVLGTTTQAAEKGQEAGENQEEHPSGAKALTHFAAVTARLKSCPDSPCCSGRVFPQAVKSCPDTFCLPEGDLPQPVKPGAVPKPAQNRATTVFPHTVRPARQRIRACRGGS